MCSQARKNKAEERQEEKQLEEQEYKSWLEENDTIKWTSLEQNGVLFPPVYEPPGVKMRYNGA